jgi:hypothetical protein
MVIFIVGRPLWQPCLRQAISANLTLNWNNKIALAVKTVKKQSDEEICRRKKEWAKDFEKQYTEVYGATGPLAWPEGKGKVGSSPS